MCLRSHRQTIYIILTYDKHYTVYVHILLHIIEKTHAVIIVVTKNKSMAIHWIGNAEMCTYYAHACNKILAALEIWQRGNSYAHACNFFLAELEI
jgi:L-asparaginase II